MRKILSFLAAAFFVALICPIALAANQVPAMELDVLLFRDGSARVTQVMEAETRGGG